MKTTTPTLLILAALLGLAVNLHSQGVAPKTPVDRLRDLKAKNEEIIEKQKAALLKLDEMDKQAEQLRFLSKRG
jgi:hypothetical protein